MHRELKKGEYTVRCQWINEDPSVVDKLKTATMRMDQKLTKGKDVSLSLYEDHVDAFGKASPATFKGNLKLFPGERKVLNLDLNLHGDSLPKEAQPGDVLVGEFGFAPEGKYELRYIVAPAPKKEEEASKDPKPSPEDEAEELPRLLAPMAKKLKSQEQKRRFLDSLIKDHPNSLPVLLARLDSPENINAQSKPEDLDAMIKAAEAVEAQVDEKDVLLWMAEKRAPVAEQSDEVKRENKKQEERKKALLAARLAKVKAILHRHGSSCGEFQEAYEAARKLLGEGSASENPAWATVRVAYHIERERLGLALQGVRKAIKELGAGEQGKGEELKRLQEQERELLDRVGWRAWAAYRERWGVLEWPRDYAPF